MSKMLLRDLSYQEQINLWGLTTHPGFDVLIQMFDEACRESAADPIRLNPIDTQNYDEKLKALTFMARCTNDFCTSVRNAINTHITTVRARQKQEELDAQLDEDADRVLSTVRLLSKQDNSQ